MKVAVIGAGIYGITVAVELAKKGHEVDLYEKGKDILMAASSINQYRLHRGYHYPRSRETIVDCLKAEAGFRKEYRGAVIDSGNYYYCIAKHGSLTLADQFTALCRDFDLAFKETKISLLDYSNISASFKVKESRIDPDALRKICLNKIRRYKINLILNVRASWSHVGQHDFVVVATYAQINNFLKSKTSELREYQFELCEKPVVALPQRFGDNCIVVIDGLFMCVDPLGKRGNYLLGNVVHAIRDSNVGPYCRIADKFKNLLDRGIISSPKITNFDKFIESGREFIPMLAEAKHIGSMYTVRAVLPYKEDTDERPTIVNRVDDKTITIFAGKFSHCVDAARQVVDMISTT